MRLFWEITLRAVRRQFTYRATELAGLVTNYFFGVFRIAVLLALYGDRPVVAGIDVTGAITYMVLTQAVLGYLSIFGWFQLAESVYTGEVAADLLKPIGLFQVWMARDLGRAIVQFLLRGVVLFSLYLPFFDLQTPPTPVQWLGVSAIAIMAWLVSFCWRFLANLAAFWSPNASGIIRFVYITSWFFSGFLMPIRYFPDWVIRLANLTPFPSMMNVVMDAFIGLLDGPAMLEALLVQAGWVVTLSLLGHLALRTGVRRLVVLGG